MKKYPITGTFIDEITYDIPSANWTKSEWIKDLDNMLDVGIDTLILIRGGFYEKTIFPSDLFPNKKNSTEDFAGFILKEAEKRNMNVFFGLYISTLTWNDGDAKTEIEKNKIFVEEIMRNYGNISSFKGWYIPHEVGNDVFNIIDVINGLSKICKDNAPEKPILLSPFFLSEVMVKDGYLSAEETFSEWDKIFSQCGQYIDYCAFQDSTAPINKMQDYFYNAKKVCDKYGIELWANVEGMDREHTTEFLPISFETLKKKIELSTPYVKKHITFEFSHFLSPQSMYEKARELNAQYKEYYNK